MSAGGGANGTSGVTKPSSAVPALPPGAKGVKIITRNIYVSRQPPAISEDDIVRCQCDPKKGHRCSPDDSCLNRILLTECTEGHCPTGDACTNQRFQRQTFAPLAIKETPGRGFGVVADGVIEEGELVAEYTGEVIAESEAERRARDALSRGERHTYFMNLGGGLVIDARKKGGIARFINHSCAPNCRTEKWSVSGETRVGIIATRTIQLGEEFSYDYQMEWRGSGMRPQKCLCGAANCAGFIGVKIEAPAPRHDAGRGGRDSDNDGGSSQLDVDDVSTYSDSDDSPTSRPAGASAAAAAAATETPAKPAVPAAATAAATAAAAAPEPAQAAAERQNGEAGPAPSSPLGGDSGKPAAKGAPGQTQGAGAKGGGKTGAAQAKGKKGKKGVGKAAAASPEQAGNGEAGAGSPPEGVAGESKGGAKAPATEEPKAAPSPAAPSEPPAAAGPSREPGTTGDAGAAAKSGAGASPAAAQAAPAAGVGAGAGAGAGAEQKPAAPRKRRGKGGAGAPGPKLRREDSNASVSWDGDPELLDWYKAPEPSSRAESSKRKQPAAPVDDDSDSDDGDGPRRKPPAAAGGYGVEKWQIRNGKVAPYHVYFYKIWELSGRDASRLVKSPSPKAEPEFTASTNGVARRRCWENLREEGSYGKCLLVKWSKKHDRELPPGAQVTDADTYFKILEPVGPQLGRLLDDDKAFRDFFGKLKWGPC